MIKNKKKLNFTSPIAGMFVPRDPVQPKPAGYDPRFIEALGDSSIEMTEEAFETGKEHRLQLEYSSYQEKLIIQKNLRIEQKAELDKIVDFVRQMEENKALLEENAN